MKKLNFEIEVSRVLEILSNDIYDSPYALLRENIQNAYDAVLMRRSAQGHDSFEPAIDVSITNGKVTISDNGIGMNEEVLQENFWKAGSSGKNTEAARRAGVVGTFGIGAMANFGIANKLEVISRSIDSEETIETSADRSNLSVTEECVDFQLSDSRSDEPGTTVVATMEDGTDLDVNSAIQYLAPYVQYIQVPIKVNGTLVSQNSYYSQFDVDSEALIATEELSVNADDVTCKLEYKLAKSGHLRCRATAIRFNESELTGDIVLSQGDGSIYGLRNSFGLAPLPVPNNFNFGGVANLSILHPTAGRDSISRESVNIVARIVSAIEDVLCARIAKFDVIDNNPQFLSYVVNRSKYELSGKVKIELKPGSRTITLDEVAPSIEGKKVYFYGGRDQSTILAFGNENSFLLHLSQNNPRRRIQLNKLKEKEIEEVPDHPQIISLVDKKELSYGEVATALRISSVLAEDYLIPDNVIQFAEISHQVPSLIEKENDTVNVFLSRASPAISHVVQTYNSAYEVFGGFVKDFVRNHLYQKFAEYVPSSTRSGADALHKLLKKNRELFKYEKEDLGDLDSLFDDYVSGELDFSEVLKRSAKIQRTHAQRVRQTQVGSAEEEIPSLTTAGDQPEIVGDIFGPMPPIDRSDSKTEKKILRTSERYSHLNNFCLFLCLSDRVYRRHVDFFLEPHTTKVIWGMHRIVYIFTHASSNLSLYYDLELKERLLDDSTGGKAIPTTTILTKNKVFIPILNDLEAFFDIQVGTKEFFVRHDIITDLSPATVD